MRLSGWVPFALVVAAGCSGDEPEVLPPLGHVVLYVDTDAPVPSAPGEPRDPSAPPPLFDRVRIDLYRPGEAEPCPGCSRDFAIDEGLLRKGASITVEPSRTRGGLVARVRLYLSSSVIDGYLRDESTIDTFVALPTAPKEGAVPASVVLATDSVGSPVGSRDAPAEATKRVPKGSKVGTWPGAQRVDCTAPPVSGEVCVPGGAYWMGNPIVHGPAEPADRRRLVVLSPFFLDAHEATVGELRASPVGSTGHVEPWSGTTDGDEFHDWCTFTPAANAAHDALPANCITWFGAQMYCQNLGKDLPSEAQFEYASSRLESSTFVWGRDVPGCEDAVWGRSGVGLLETFTDKCRPAGSAGGPLALDASGTGRNLDRLVMPTGTIYDLAGNVAEWGLDWFNGQDEPCWAPRPEGNVLYDPVCQTKGAIGSFRSVRGGEWIDDYVALRAASRIRRDPTFIFDEVGFRCARPGS